MELSEEFLSTFWGTLFALLSAGVVWVIKTAYDKHSEQNLALAKFERMYALNLTILKDSLIFIEQWITSAKNNRVFSYKFEKLIINEENTYKISDLKLINRILSTNYMTNRMSSDLDNLYKTYWEIILKIDSLPEDKKEVRLKEHNETIVTVLEQVKLNFPVVEKNMKEIVAHIRVLGRIRKNSLFEYIKIIFFTDIFPRFSENSFESEKEKLEVEIAKKILDYK